MRNPRQLAQDVIRECRGQCTVMEARQALQDALKMIDQSANWEFLISTELINLNAPQSSGTVVVVAGTTSVKLFDAVWTGQVTSEDYWEIKFADRQMAYRTYDLSTTTLSLKTPLSGTTDIVNGNYVLYQARYSLPETCEPGRDLSLKGPQGTGESFDGNIPKRERLIYDRYSSELRTGFVPQYYTDDEYNENLKRGTIRIEPYPTRTYELRMTFYRSLAQLIFVASADDAASSRPYLTIPEAFERIPILIASSDILRRKNMNGWQTMRQEAADMLNKMYNRYAASAAYEGKIAPNWSDLLDDSDDMFGADSIMYTR